MRCAPHMISDPTDRIGPLTFHLSALFRFTTVCAAMFAVVGYIGVNGVVTGIGVYLTLAASSLFVTVLFLIGTIVIWIPFFMLLAMMLLLCMWVIGAAPWQKKTRSRR